MKLKLVREQKLPDRSIGKLYIDGVFFCDTLEDLDRDLSSDMPLHDIQQIKVYGATAIPTGSYRLVMSYSEKFKQYLPLLLNVPGYSGIRIHSGNIPEHTLGCILVGKLYKDQVINSRVTFNKLYSLLNKVEKKESITIEII